ncbi:unnamed protein product, partial [Effrenium voratum]
MEEEEVLNKSGPELFKELRRFYSVAQVEDYFKHGVWRDELMRTDLRLIAVHRREAGAPEPPDLSEVQVPDLPRGAVAPMASMATTLGASVGELRLLALFVAKWKLDVTRTKATLTKLLPARRRYVIANFKGQGDSDINDQLETYISQCEATNAWAAWTNGAGLARPVASPHLLAARSAMTRPPLTISPRP